MSIDRKITLTFLLSISILGMNTDAQLPFKYDSLYKTIYASDLNKVSKTPDFVLIDVRTAGEFSDTSDKASLNIGRLKGAINISIDSITSDIHTLDAYKDNTIVFYCSHSQRSRRVCKFLTENGYTKVYNLNGGMSDINQLEDEFPDKEKWIVSNTPFKILSYEAVSDLLKNEKNLLVIDIRPKEQFNSEDSLLENNVGRIKKAVNISYDNFSKEISGVAKKKDQSILIYTTTGDGDAYRAASELVKSGYTKVNYMLNGISGYVASQGNKYVDTKNKFTLLNTPRSLELLQGGNTFIIDARADDEYNNKMPAMLVYKNLGHIRNALHVSDPAFEDLKLPLKKDSPILIYSGENAYRVANEVVSRGYENVYVMRSYYDFVWSGFNVENCKETKKFLTDHDGFY